MRPSSRSSRSDHETTSVRLGAILLVNARDRLRRTFGSFDRRAECANAQENESGFHGKPPTDQTRKRSRGAVVFELVLVEEPQTIKLLALLAPERADHTQAPDAELSAVALRIRLPLQS